MGASFIPLAGGNFLAGILSGDVYAKIADKITLLQKEVAARGLELPAISEHFTQNDYVSGAAGLMNMNERELTNYLWNTYHPGNIWMVFAGIGLATVALLFVYDRFILKSKATN